MGPKRLLNTEFQGVPNQTECLLTRLDVQQADHQSIPSSK